VAGETAAVGECVFNCDVPCGVVIFQDEVIADQLVDWRVPLNGRILFVVCPRGMI
jgi:hypothetical protein